MARPAESRSERKKTCWSTTSIYAAGLNKKAELKVEKLNLS